MHQRIQRPPVPGAKASSSMPLASKAAPRAPAAQSDPAALPGDERSGSVQLLAPHRATDLLHAKPSSAEHDSRGQELIARELATRVRPQEPPPNRTGLPDNLKAGVEGLSGISLDGVKVHFNSSRPAQLDAFAYAKSREIFVAPGQERHLPHEAWHLIQQAQGHVIPTRRMEDGTLVSDDEALERDADVMGRRSAAGVAPAGRLPKLPVLRPIEMQFDPGVAQLVKIADVKLDESQKKIVESSQFGQFVRERKQLPQSVILAFRKRGELPVETAQELYGLIDAFRGKKGEQVAHLQPHEYRRAQTLFGFARDQLGTPLNDPAWKDQAGADARAQAPVGTLYNRIKERMGISKEDEERNSEHVDLRIDWMIKSAALAVAVGGGVCNSFGSLTAIMLRLEGVRGVKLLGSDTHNWAGYGAGANRIGLDPWKKKDYELESEEAGAVTIDLDAIQDTDALYAEFKRQEQRARQLKEEILAADAELREGYNASPHAGRASYTIVWEEAEAAGS